MRRMLGFVASLALMVTVIGANSTCFLIAHQPEMPEGAKKFRKI